VVNSVGEFFFWLSFSIIFYAYAGYPFLLWVSGFIVKRPVMKGRYEPTVSVIISAFNEENVIEDKIKNLLSLNYPADKLEILVGSDGASDQTDHILSRVESLRVKFFRFVSNQGKAHVLNALVKEARGQVLLFTDARQPLQQNALQALVGNFKDPAVGCVSGEMYFEEVLTAATAKGMGFYWNYEKFLRKKESTIGSMLGATGAIYAIRRELYPGIPIDILVDDMYVPLTIVKKGYRAVFETDACAFDHASQRGAQEIRRKVRTLAGNYQIFSKYPELLNPFTSPIAWQLFSHKVLRLWVPFLLIVLWVSNGFLVGMPFYRWVFTAQVVFYGLSAIEAVLELRRSGSSASKPRKGIGYLPYTFCLLNYSAFLGFFTFVFSKPRANWRKAYS